MKSICICAKICSMMAWKAIRGQVNGFLCGDSYWGSRLGGDEAEDGARRGIHLAVLVEPFLEYILEGRKTVESRFSIRRVAPFDRVDSGDIVLLKRSCGPIVGLCEVSDVWFYHLDPASWLEIREDYGRALCIEDPEFWRTRQHTSFATLMRLQHTRELPPVPFPKRDRRGWVVLRRRLPKPLEEEG
jgi:hypothetical protein